MLLIKGMIPKVKIKICFPLILGSPHISFCQDLIKVKEMLVQEEQTGRAIVSFYSINFLELNQDLHSMIIKGGSKTRHTRDY
jgi:hypothetical protein